MTATETVKGSVLLHPTNFEPTVYIVIMSQSNIKRFIDHSRFVHLQTLQSEHSI